MRQVQGQKTIREWSSQYGQIFLAWLLVASIFGLLMWQIYGLAMTGAWALIQSETFRPIGWSTATLRGVSRCVIPSAAMIWFAGIMYAWNRLEYDFGFPHFWTRVGRAFGIIFAVYAVAAILVRFI